MFLKEHICNGISQVTKDVTDYLKAADEKRKKRNEEMGTKKKSYNDDNVQDHNEYSDRMEYVNTRVKAKIAAMRNIIDGSKATTGNFLWNCKGLSDVFSSTEPDFGC